MHFPKKMHLSAFLHNHHQKSIQSTQTYPPNIENVFIAINIERTKWKGKNQSCLEVNLNFVENPSISSSYEKKPKEIYSSYLSVRVSQNGASENYCAPSFVCSVFFGLCVWCCWDLRQLRTWIHHNHCDLTIKSGTGQHSQYLRCFEYFPLLEKCKLCCRLR